MPKLFSEGDLALVVDNKNRHHLIKLGPGKVFHSHQGLLAHEEIIGREDGSRLKTHSGREMVVLRPGLADYILKMGRSAQVIYPKDIGPMLVAADIYPGASVLEAGLGSGAMTLALLRAVGPTGRVVTYEIREDMGSQAQRNIEAFMPGVQTFQVKYRDVYEGVDEREVDRVILDLPEPWRMVPIAAEALRSGGIFLSYLPTVLQLHKLYEALAQDPRFDFIEAFEVLQRPWHLAPTSARPEHRMVAHTGFITKAIRCAPRASHRPLDLSPDEPATEDDDGEQPG